MYKHNLYQSLIIICARFMIQKNHDFFSSSTYTMLVMQWHVKSVYDVTQSNEDASSILNNDINYSNAFFFLVYFFFSNNFKISWISFSKCFTSYLYFYRALFEVYQCPSGDNRLIRSFYTYVKPWFVWRNFSLQEKRQIVSLKKYRKTCILRIRRPSTQTSSWQESKQ